MEAIDVYLQRLREPGVRDRLRQLYHIEGHKGDRSLATDKQVAAAERELGFPLPPSYKKLVTTVSRFDGGCEVRGIIDPHGIGADIVSANRNRLAPFLIELVACDNGDSYCFDTRHPDERGEYTIVHFDHEIHNEESTDFETVGKGLGEFLLGSLPEAASPEAAATADRVDGLPSFALVGKGKSLLSRQVRRLAELVATVFAALSSLWSSPAAQVPSTSVRKQARTEMSPLLAAVGGGDLQKVSALLSAGADPNAVSMSSTPLRTALRHENKEMVSLLLERGADPRALDHAAQSHLQMASERDPALGAWLLRQIQDVTVTDAAEAGTLDDLRKVVDKGGDVNMVTKDRRLLSPLQAAVRRDDLEMAAYLLDRGADLHYRGTWDSPVLFIAATHVYSAKMTELLLRRGADPNSTDSDGHTPLYLVAQTYWPDVLDALIRGGADANFRAPDESTPLHAAAGHNTDPETRAIRILVKHGAKLDAQDRLGYTPLHTAMDHTNASAAMTLLDLGADPAVRDNEGRTPAQLVSENVRFYPGIPEVLRRLSPTP